MKPLSKVQFYGVMASACWALAVTVYYRQHEMPRAQQYAMSRYFVCVERETAAGRGNGACLDQVSDDWDAWMNRQWAPIARLSLIPVAVAWVAGYAGMRLLRRR